MTEEKQPWDRQPGETSRSYELFSIYRNLGPQRSLPKAKASSETTPSLSRLKQHCKKHNWVERCRAYDDYREMQERVEEDKRREKERREMADRHAKIAVLGQNIVVKGVEKLLADMEQGKRDPSASDLSRLLDVAVKVERLSRGVPTEISQRNADPLQDLLDEFRKQREPETPPDDGAST
jgi:hypothetical protein